MKVNFGKQTIFFKNGMNVIYRAKRSSVKISCPQYLHLQIFWGVEEKVLEDITIEMSVSEVDDKWVLKI